MPSLTVIIPTYNAASGNAVSGLAALLAQLTGDFDGTIHIDDIIVSDGGSTDATLNLAVGTGARIAIGTSGRGRQLARGAQLSALSNPREMSKPNVMSKSSDWLLFLHADSQLPDSWQSVVASHMHRHSGRAGYFRFKLNDTGVWPRMVEFWVRLRCFWLALPYGDQGLLIERDLFDAVGGYPKWDLFEDVQIVRTLGRRRLKNLKLPLITDARKFKRDGYGSRTFKNLGLLIKFLMGAKPEDLARQYK